MAAALFGVFFGFVVLDIPIAIALFAGAAIPLFLYTNVPMVAIAQKFFLATDSFPFMAIPFFIIAGGLLERGGVSKRLVNFASSLVGGLPGGLAIVTFVACAFFGAISGSATATVIAIGSIMVPAMLHEGYPLRFALATIASAGYLGIIIPPSIPMVIYGMATGTSVTDVFMAGFIPGTILMSAMSLYAFYFGRKYMKITKSFSPAEVWRTFKEAIWALMMPGIILGGIYGGIFTPTEAAAVACLYGVIVGFFVYRELTLKSFYDILRNSVVSSSMIMFIVAAALAFGWVMTRDLIPNKVADFIISVSASPYVFLLLVNILLLIVGTFMETCAAIMILGPMFLPICQQMNIDMTAFGIVMVVNLAIGFLTPPLGLNLFVAAGLQNTKVDNVINIHLLWYIIISTVVLMFLTYVPSVSTFLPYLFR